MQDGQIQGQTGRAVHGLWHNSLSPELSERLHAQAPAAFTLSPLMGLPRPSRGQTKICQGQAAWFRLSLLADENYAALLERWQASLPKAVELAGLQWEITAPSSAEHPWGRAESYQQLISQPLPGRMRFEFLTPVTFNSGRALSGKDIFLPFPLPDSLFKSWLRRWNAFAPAIWHIPPDLPNWARQVVSVSAYRLQTIPVRYGQRVHIGCVGTVELKFINCPANIQKYFGWLARYAFYCGSGAKTTQGMGMTKVEDCED